MAKTFNDITGETVEIIKRETSVDFNEDIITGKISNFFVCVSDYRYRVTKDVYEAVEKLINN